LVLVYCIVALAKKIWLVGLLVVPDGWTISILRVKTPLTFIETSLGRSEPPTSKVAIGVPSPINLIVEVLWVALSTLATIPVRV
jgi:hypothetical protein